MTKLHVIHPNSFPSKVFSEKGALESYLLRSKEDGFHIAGVDEVGRGCLAGPVYTAAVILDYDALETLDEKTLGLIRDSKKLSTKQRKAICPVIEKVCLSYSVAKSEVEEVDALNILQATYVAMRRSLAGLSIDPDITLVDGHQPISGYEKAQVTLVGGDDLAYAVAAASILAKEARDTEMIKASEIFPAYGFDTHVGYGTKKHLEALQSHGVTPLHRKTFAPVRRILESAPS